MNTWNIAGKAWFRFRTKKQCEKAIAEGDVEKMLMDACLYISGKYPGVELETSSLAINQRLSERIKP